MEIFHRKGDRGELERAVDNFNDMLGHVDRLGEMITEARAMQRAAAHGVVEATDKLSPETGSGTAVTPNTPFVKWQ